METYDKEVLLDKNLNFDPEKTFTCGQCFRWIKLPDDSFEGVVRGKLINVKKQNEKVFIRGIDEDEFSQYLSDYFDLKRDYGEIDNFLKKDPVISPAVACGSGIKILNQDFFETVISFIISANNNIPRIQGIIERLCKMFGKHTVHKNGKEFYSFPSSQDMQGVTEEDLAPLRSGYRAKYISRAVESFNNGEIDEEYIKSLEIYNARKELCRISGVGPKVADCILLFSLGRFDAFPTDVWIKRVMSELYGCSEKEAAALGEKLYGNYAGIAQQYLFFWRRGV